VDVCPAEAEERQQRRNSALRESGACGESLSPRKLNEVPPISLTILHNFRGYYFMLITRETKLEIVLKHLEKGIPLRELSEERLKEYFGHAESMNSLEVYGHAVYMELKRTAQLLTDVFSDLLPNLYMFSSILTFET
jgi:hypothetical protein